MPTISQAEFESTKFIVETKRHFMKELLPHLYRAEGKEREAQRATRRQV